MGDFGSLLDGFATALQPMYLLYALLGVTLGTAVGVLPGIGPAMTVALLLPVTYTLQPTAAFIMFAGIYYGGMYGGSTTSILLNTPGESASIITAIEGNLMAKKGRGAAALATAAIGSFVAGTIATVLLTLLAPAVARVAIQLGPPDYVALTVVALLTVSALLGSSVSRGLAALAIGALMGLVGTDTLTGQQRFTLGMPALADGIDVVTVAVGVFAVGEALFVASRLRHGTPQVMGTNGAKWMSRKDFSRSWRPWLRGTALGFPIGAMPAGGAEIPTFLSYAIEKKLTKHPEEFGHGAIEGVAGPEAANNASAAGVLVPLLTLGLPTSATAAVLIAAFQSYGIRPGPLLFQSNGALVWALIASLYVGNVLLLVLNLPLVGLWVKVLQIPRHYLYAGIMLFAALGAYALNGVRDDLILLFAIGVLGYVMRRFGYPIAPAIIGLILGPIAEEQLRRTLAISQGDPVALVDSPFAAIMYSLLLLGILVTVALRLRGRHRQGTIYVSTSEVDRTVDSDPDADAAAGAAERSLADSDGSEVAVTGAGGRTTRDVTAHEVKDEADVHD